MTQESCFTRDPLLRTFGAVLRSHREGAGLSRPHLAEALGCGAGWIEKLETAQKPPSEATADDLDVFFETPSRLFWVLWREIKRGGKHLAAPAGCAKFVHFEAKAVAIYAFEARAVPGLLQTPGYARAVMSTGRPRETVDEHVSARMKRQEILVRDNGPRTWFVLDEAVPRRPFGGRDVMSEQITRLIELATSHPRLELRGTAVLLVDLCRLGWPLRGAQFAGRH